MAQLYDCFAEGGLLPLEKIYQMIENLEMLVAGCETVPLADMVNQSVRGRLLAKDIMAPIDVPHFANSAVDGYGFSYQDYQHQLNENGKAFFQITASIEAGAVKKYHLKKNEAAIIFTGAPMPASADTIVMLEDIQQDIFSLQNQLLSKQNPMIEIPKGLKQYDNYRPVGDDLQKNDKIFNRCDELTPPMLAMMSALGIQEVPLLPSLRVALMSSGDELRADGEDLSHGQIYDANRPLLKNLLHSYGVQIHDYGIVPDNLEDIRTVFHQASENHHLLISSGGMSEGGKDYIRHLLEQEGKLSFLRAAIKPGRPLGIGYWQDMPIIGLPGNPVAAFTVFLLIALPMMMKLQGRKKITHAMQFPALTDFSCDKRPQRVEYIRVKIKSYDTKTGLPILSRYGKKGAGVISSLIGVDGFAVLAHDTTQVKQGDRVHYIPLRQFF